jgi:hypothetical protein
MLAYLQFYLLLLGTAAAQLLPFDQTLPILTTPVVQVKAGGYVYYQYTRESHL